MGFSRLAIRWLALAAAVTLLVGLLAACKSGDGDDDGKTPAAETPAGDETPADGGGDGGDEGLRELERLASEASGDFTGKVTYSIRMESGGITTEQEWTLAQRPPDTRWEIVSNEDGQEARTIVIQTAETTYFCASSAGSETCFESDETEQYTGLFDPIINQPRQIVDSIDTLGIGDRSERQIGGLNATCFTYSIAGTESETCFSGEGLLLYLRGESAGGSYTFEATSASTDVSDADFEPPYEVFDVPTG